VAIAAKQARILWALLAKGRIYQPPWRAPERTIVEEVSLS